MFYLLSRIIRILLRIVITFLVLSVGLTVLYRWMPVYLTPLMVIRSMEQKKEGKDIVLKHDWVSLESISEHLQLAVVCSEDQNYLRHSGFDWKAIEKAFENNEAGKKLRGGSTISQQTAKNVFLWPGRSYIRKGFEAYFTLLIEVIWSKERILEIYLNSIEMGKGIYGAEAAARHWFKKPASELTKDESAALTAILPNPDEYVANPAGPYIARRKEWIKQQMNFWGNQLDFKKYKEDKNEPEKKPEKLKEKKKQQ
jgi:monofunctional glycosyltransferase